MSGVGAREAGTGEGEGRLLIYSQLRLRVVFQAGLLFKLDAASYLYVAAARALSAVMKEFLFGLFVATKIFRADCCRPLVVRFFLLFHFLTLLKRIFCS